MTSEKKDPVIEYIKDLDLVFSRLINRFRWLFRKYSSDEITGTQLAVLRCLRSEGACTTSYLAEMLGVTLSAITALINRLYRQGLASRERKEQDRRQVWINITPQGLQYLHDAEQSRYFLLSMYFSKLTEEERVEFLRMLRKVSDIFESDDPLQ